MKFNQEETYGDGLLNLKAFAIQLCRLQASSKKMLQITLK